MPIVPEFFIGIDGFQWDEGNADKNWHLHQVRQAEAEQMFLNRPLLVLPDPAHSAQEARYLALGRTDGGRLLMAAFTLRGSTLRVISVRTMSRRERGVYAKAEAR